MNQRERLKYLVEYLLKEKTINIDIPATDDELFSLYRSLVNIREAAPISKEFIEIEGLMLEEETNKKGIVELDKSQRIIVWKGDITRLKVDVIVNAANNRMEGCFIPEHHCIDNAIHTYAGIELRNECHQIMTRQGFLEPVGKAKITKAYHLPSRYILHTVGPIIKDIITTKDEILLASCYESCLRLAEDHHLSSIAFCCISTGVYHFPPKRAAEIAVKTIQKYLQHSNIKQVIFNVFSDQDEEIYHQILSHEIKIEQK
ncbi:protein-ADP-ribose hydrolase [Candidatus Stoquefichus massiliensis]|uniref:protein-ADP-ribose hydrolase n=1 Tax=Candidatus Stoquefichus massiliensis TaxID=1470350 RepID=UPI0004849A9E|nr:protein-ADP-ribose hydrolase [Candidatus Stoquefichus massiliensis]